MASPNPDVWTLDPPTQALDEAAHLFDPTDATASLVTISRAADNQAADEMFSLIRYAAAAGPRNPTTIAAEAQRTGEVLGALAFYSWEQGPKDKKVVIEGPTINLAYALAQVWGRCMTRVTIEESRGNEVRLRGRFFDLATVTVTDRDYMFTLAPAPGKFAADPYQTQRWRTLQEQASASKAVRGAIIAGIPGWVTHLAMEAAQGRIRALALEVDKDGRPRLTLGEARAKAIASLEAQGLAQSEVETWMGRPSVLWTVGDLGRLRELWLALARGTVVVDALRADLAASADTATQAPADRKPEVRPGANARKAAPAPDPVAASQDFAADAVIAAGLMGVAEGLDDFADEDLEVLAPRQAEPARGDSAPATLRPQSNAGRVPPVSKAKKRRPTEDDIP